MAIPLRRLFVIGHDLVMVAAAWSLSVLIRFDFAPPAFHLSTFAKGLALVVTIQAAVLWGSGLYKGLWRFASIRDLGNIIRAATVGVLFIGLALILYNRFEGVPRSVMVMYPLFLIFLLGAPRLLYRIWKDKHLGLLAHAGTPQRVLVLGAGRAGEMLVRDMLRDPDYQPLGFLDDQAGMHGTKVHGVPVLGPIASLPDRVRQLQPDIVIIAIPSAPAAQMRRIVDVCEQTKVPFRTLPRLGDMVGSPSTRELREVSLDDLLGREPVALDWQRISAGLTGKTVLVSGGGGSIGSELCRQLARLSPRRLIVLERSEYNLYEIDRELRRQFPDLALHARLGDVRDRATVDAIFSDYRPAVVFHAAAYKHVPLLEGQVREALFNNVVGTRVMAEVADRHGCESFVLISTDKAVNPANVMGTSKRIAELFCQNLDFRSRTRYVTVRFGNVLGSTGSVIPLFKRQIAEGGPLTVTHPEITRFFMTIPEAAQLITQAVVMGSGGEIFVLDMGEPVKIRYLAEQLIRLSGKTPGQHIDIVYTGLRPGEKLYEELFHAQEPLSPTAHPKILLARCRKVDWQGLVDTLDGLEQACQDYDSARLRTVLDVLVPEHLTAASDATVIPLRQA